MPGPFNSDKIKGVFSRDTASIKQNDVWSSATFNNFVKSVYNVFYNESAYSRIFNNYDEPRLMVDCSQTDASNEGAVDDGAGNAVKTPNVWFHNNTEKQRIEMSVVDRDFNAGADVSDGEVWQHNLDSLKKLLLFSGRGDWSACVKPYALFQVKTEASETQILELRDVPSSEADTTNITYDAYCCITYEEGYPVDNYTEMSGSEITPRYTSLAEITFKFDPELSSRVISRVDGYPVGKKGTPPDQEDITVKLILSYGPQATLIDFVNYINSIQCLDSVKKLNAVIVGNYLQGQTLAEALYINGAVPSEVSTKTIRFVPIRPCISITSNSSDKNFPNLTKPALDSIDAITTYAIMQQGTGSSTVSEAAVFKYPGTYGFIIDNNMISAPTMHDAMNLRLVYVPNKNKKGHYVPQSSAIPQPLPDWYDKLPGVITRADTEDFNEEFFFIPFITVTDRTIEIGGFSIDIDTILIYGDVTAPIEPNSGVSQVPKESEVLYDSYRYKHCGQESEQLLNDAAAIFKSTAEMLKKGEPTSTENIPLGEHASTELVSEDPKVFALERTLQFMVGLNWKNSDIIWVDPLLGVADDCIGCSVRRSRKMYGSVAQAILDDVHFGRGSLITPNTVFIHITDSGEAIPAYSNDPASPKYQDDSAEDFTPHRNMWRKVYSEYLPAGVKHFAFKAKPSLKGVGATIVSDDFPGLDFSAGIQPLFIRLAQDPNLGLEVEKKDNYLRQSSYPLNIQEFPDYIDHLYCVSALTGEYIDLNSEYYPLTGQDFSGVSHVVVDDPEVGLRVPGKIPNMRIFIERVNATKFTYIPRTHWFVPSDENPHYESQTLNYRNGSTTNSSVYTSYSTGMSPVNFYLPNEDGAGNGWRPSTYATRKRLDWIAYNGEVIIHSSSIKTIDQSIHQFKDNSEGTYMVVGASISFYNINPCNASNVIFHSGIITVRPEITTPNGVTPAVEVNVPSAGKLMLWRSHDLTCDAEVSLLNFCGKGGSQVVTYKPVAWPFTAKNNDNPYVASQLSVAYSYSISRVTDNEAKITGSAENDVLCTFGAGSTYPTADVRGGSIDLTLCFEDRRGYDQETRSRSAFKALIKTKSEVSDCDIKIRIVDKGNILDWYPPSSDPNYLESPHYEVGRWQAFDPDIFLPKASWRSSTDDWASNFAFIECTHFDEQSGYVFRDCRISVDLTQDAVYYEINTVGAGSSRDASEVKKPYRVTYVGNRMFFSSRIFRKSAYIFYFFGAGPTYFCDSNLEQQGLKQSTGVDLSIISGRIKPVWAESNDKFTLLTRAAWWPDTSSISAFPSSTSQARNFTTWHTAQFIFGLSCSSITVDHMRVIPVIRRTFEFSKYVGDATNVPRVTVSEGNYTDTNTALALFSNVSNCLISLNYLDTTYPLEDEWFYVNSACYAVDPYNIESYGEAAYWAETGNGFMLFTQAVTVKEDDTPHLGFNNGNTVSVNLWTTRTLLSGIYGLENSVVTLNYDFTTQSYDLLACSFVSQDYLDGVLGNLEKKGSWYEAAKRPRYWSQVFSDPGAVDSRSKSGTIEDFTIQHVAVFLPCFPLFYLSEVDTCDINLMLSSKPGHAFIARGTENSITLNRRCGRSMPCNSSRYPDPGNIANKYKARLYSSLAGHWFLDSNGHTSPVVDDLPVMDGSPIPNAGESVWFTESQAADINKSVNARRTFRLSLGFAPILSNGTGRLLTTSSGNSVKGIFNRVNLVAGVYNHISGWCYELVPEIFLDATYTGVGTEVEAIGNGVVSYIPYRYLLSSDASQANIDLVDYEYPAKPSTTLDLIATENRLWAKARAVNAYTSITKTYGMLDNVDNTSFKSLRKIFTLDIALARNYRHTTPFSDIEDNIYEILAYTQVNATSGGELNDGLMNPMPDPVMVDHYLPHSSSGVVGNTVMWFYPKNARRAGICEMSVNPVLFTSNLDNKSQDYILSGSSLFAPDAYNTADLNTILISTLETKYFGLETYDRNNYGWDYVPGVLPGYPLHTVLAYTKVVAQESVNSIVRNAAPDLDDDIIDALTNAILSGEVTVDGDSFSIVGSEGAFAGAGLDGGTILANIWAAAAQAGSGMTVSQEVDGAVTNPGDGVFQQGQAVNISIAGLSAALASVGVGRRTYGN